MRPAALGALLAVLAGAISAGSLPAQVAVAETGIHRLSVGDAELTEVVLPFGVSWGWSGVRFDLNSAWATAAYEQDGVNSRLSGLTDLTLRLMVPVLDDRARVIVAGNIPTGTETLGSSQLPVAAVLTTDLLALPVRSFGSGAGLAAGVAVARPVGEWVAGGIAVYRVGSGFEPLVAGPGERAAEFRPGSEMRLRLALERPRVSGVTVRLASSWSRFGSDQTDDQAVFSRGDRFMGEAVAEFPYRSGSAMLYGWNLYRSGSEFLADDSPERVPASTLFGVGARGTYPLSRSMSVMPRIELTIQRGDVGFGGGDGWIAKGGSGVSYRFDRFRVEPAALIQLGALNGEDIRGLVLRAGVLWER